MAKLSPMLQQYLDIKAQHKDHVLFFRLGDFYEMFFDDAIKISKELELTLTGRDCGLPERAPMCGIPYHAADGYIKKLINKGYKVAVCEQTEDPASAKGLVKRDIVRIITPGTVIESDMLNEEKNNYIASLIIEGQCFAVCFADVSTGEVFLTQKKSDNLSMDIINELTKFTPSEIMFNDEFLNHKDIHTFVKDKLSCVCEMYTKDELEIQVCTDIVENHFKEKSVAELGLSGMQTAIKSLGALIVYINSTQIDASQRIADITLYDDNKYMAIDLTARRNLEITENSRDSEKQGTLLWALDKTKTAMGKRYIRQALEQPLLSISEISRRQAAVSELFKDSRMSADISNMLAGVYDIERLMTRVLYGTVTPRELRSLAFTISKLPQIKKTAMLFNSKYLKDIEENINTLDDVYNLIDNAITENPPALLKDGGIIKLGFNTDLDEYRKLCGNAKDYIAEIETKERKKTGISKLKIGYNRVFGYYIEVTKSNIDSVPEEYIRKQTLANCERYITQELKELETKVLTASDKILALETEIFSEIRKYVALKSQDIATIAAALARLDFILSLANVARENGYVCPVVNDSGKIVIKNGRHPVVEKMLKDSVFVPNDILLDQSENKMAIITGPNMAGKSTYMRQAALIVIMAQIGSFVPASSAEIGICDRVFTRVGASDDLSAGQSTFMVEMSEVAHILKNATKNSLVILDEIGRGTSTYDGMSIAKAVVAELLNNKSLGCKTMFATHYHELTELENEYKGIKNYNIAVKKRGDDITFLRKIIRGGADESYGIEVAKLAGVPENVVRNAKEFLVELDNGTAKTPKLHIENNNEDEQTSFSDLSENEAIEKLRNIDINTLTPIEALNAVYEMKKLIEK